jgi:transcription elongation factor Elf1
VSNWLDVKYVNLLSGRLRNFKRKSNNLYNFSCPICNDSETNSRKARGYIYEKKGRMIFHCHNCSATMNISFFLKTLDTTLYNEYVIENLKDSKTVQQLDLESFVQKMKPPKFLKSEILKDLKKVSQLSPDNPIKKFVSARKIPNIYHSKLFACPKFRAFTNNIIPDKFDEKALLHDETRLLIPFINEKKDVHAFQGRTLGKSEFKYITIVTDESIPKVYGLDTVNLNKPTYVVEGPIDSMFISNSIATAGGDLVSTLSSFRKDELIIVYDNEPRSIHTIKKIEKAISLGYKVCIWPDYVNHKDINDMILGDMTSEHIEYIIKENTFKDLTAKLKLSQWSKI